MGSCLELLERLSRAGSVDDLHAVCSELCRRLGFDHFIYGARLPTSFHRPYLVVISGYPSEWRERYISEGYLQIDPTVSYCENNVTPIIWDRLDLQQVDAKVRQFMTEAQDFGLRSGFSIPIHGPRGALAMLSLSSGQAPEQIREQIREALPIAHLFSGHLHEAARQLIDVREIPQASAQLTEREKECLLWAADGKTSWETAQIIGISERTVIFHLQNATTKLNVSNRQQAIARAVAMRLITPQFA